MNGKNFKIRLRHIYFHQNIRVATRFFSNTWPLSADIGYREGEPLLCNSVSKNLSKFL